MINNTQYKNAKAIVSMMMYLGEDLTIDQVYTFDKLVTLIEQYEDKHFILKSATEEEIAEELRLAKLPLS